MGATKNRATEGRLPERRNRRSGCLADALRLQLETCREQEGLAAIVVSDELGFCVAHSGGDGAHDELAAQLPMLAQPGGQLFRDPDEREGWTPARDALTVTTFPVGRATLHACAVAAPAGSASTADGTADSAAVLARVASGFTRLLAE
jgi:hypothetical protein